MSGTDELDRIATSLRRTCEIWLKRSDVVDLVRLIEIARQGQAALEREQDRKGESFATGL